MPSTFRQTPAAQNPEVFLLLFLQKKKCFLYYFFMHKPLLPSRGFTRAGAEHRAKGGSAMGDAVAVIYGIFVFVLLILYVKGCEKV